MSINSDGKSFRHIYLAVIFIALGLIAYSNILDSYFLSDDFVQIGKVLRGDLSVTWGQSQGGFFRPVFIFSYWIDAKIWGARPLGFHITNVALHSINSSLVFRLAIRLLPELRPGARTKRLVALGAALLFLVHPSHTEAVSWISGRADLLATLFCLISMLCFIACNDSERAVCFVFSLASFLLALLAKESAICLPFLILIIAGARRRADGRIRPAFLKVIGPYFALLLAFVLVRWLFLGSLVGGYGSTQHLNFSPSWIRDRILQAELRSILPALPWEWSSVFLKPLQSGRFLALALICTVAICLLISLRRRHCDPQERGPQNRTLLLLVLLFLVSLVPVMNLRLSLFDTQGERFVYLPSVFACVVIAYLTAILIPNSRFCLVILIGILSFYSVRLYRTNTIWRDASELSRNVRDQVVAASSSDRLVILNAPDNLKGVPVYHNGLADALQYFQSQKFFADVQVISIHNLQSLSDEIEVTSTSASVDLSLLRPGDAFVEAHDAGCVRVINQTKLQLQLQIDSCGPTTDLFYWQGGKMNRLVGK